MRDLYFSRSPLRSINEPMTHLFSFMPSLINLAILETVLSSYLNLLLTCFERIVILLSFVTAILK